MLPPLYDLTPLTGKKSNENRTTVVANIEMKPRTKWVVLISFVASLPVAAIFALFMGLYGTIAIPLVIGGAHLLFNARTSSGLKQRNIETLLDKKKSGDNQFYLCGKQVEVGQSVFGVIRRTVVPIPAVETEGKK